MKPAKILIGVGIFLVLIVSLIVALKVSQPVPLGGINSFQTTEAPSMAIPGFGAGGVANPASERASLQSGQIMAKGMPESAPFAASDISSGQDIPDKKVIKNGNLTLKVDNADESSTKISQIAKDNAGEVFSSNFYESPKNIKSGSITVKVPVNNFEKTLVEMKKVATLVVQESTTGQDVTEEYTDLQSRLKNKQAEEEQFVRIMQQAQKIQDILDVTRELSRVRGEIEMLRGRIKFLNSQTDMASIFISLTEDESITVTDSWRPLQVAKAAVNSLIKKVQGFINFTIVLLVTVMPIMLLYLLLAYIIYVIGRKIYQKLREKKDSIQ